MQRQMGIFDDFQSFDYPYQEKPQAEPFHCPFSDGSIVCRQLPEHYEIKIPLPSCNTRALIVMVRQWTRLREKRALNLREFCRSDNSGYSSFAKTRLWRLVVPVPNKDPKLIHSGYYLPTTHGINFVYGRLKIYSHIIHGPKRAFVAWSGKKIDVRQALRESFDWREYCRINDIPILSGDEDDAAASIAP